MKTAGFDVYKAKDGWRWRLIAANNRVVATGESHLRKRDAERAMLRLGDLCIQAMVKHLGAAGKMTPKTTVREKV